MFNEQGESLRSLHITHFTVEHVVVPSRYSFEEIITALEAKVGVYGNWEIIPHQLAASKADFGARGGEATAIRSLTGADLGAG